MEVKLETMELANGVVIEAESFEPGQSVFAIADEDRIPLPEGEYELADGRVLTVQPEGVIEAIGEAAAEEEAPVEEEMEADQKPKAIVESVVKETKFSEEFALSDAQLNALAEKVASILSEEEVIAEIEIPEEEVEQIVENIEEKLAKQELETRKFSPEEKKETKKNYFTKKPQSIKDRVLSKLSN